MTTELAPPRWPSNVTGHTASLATVIRLARVRAGLTQESLAELAGVSARTIRNLESRRIVAPRQSSLRALVDALAIDAEVAGDLFALAARY